MTISKSGWIYELAILGRVTWSLHSLNNEGQIGNVMEPRSLMLADGTATDGISGEMLKHIHAAAVWALEDHKEKFCAGCRVLDPMRANLNTNVTQTKTVEEATDRALSDCQLCDLHGFMVQRPTVHRISTIQFGWAVGLPQATHTSIHQHARHAVGERGRSAARVTQEGSPEDETDVPGTARAVRSSATQMLYSRPTRSGTYALVSLFQPWRIGLNTVTYRYVEGLDRRARYRLALQAYQTMFWRTDGAMTATRLPHLEAFEGVLVIARRNVPVPVLSPVNEEYRSGIERLVKTHKGAMESLAFDDIQGFVSALQALAASEPYALSIPVGESE